jgi:putative redox protein
VGGRDQPRHAGKARHTNYSGINIMKATVHWQKNMTFTGNSESGFPVVMDADQSVGGDSSAIRPMEMMLFGLAGCTAMDVLSILRKKRQDVTQFEVRVDAPRSREYPQVFTSAVILYCITGRNINEGAVLRSIELTSTKYCPAQFMFAELMPIELHYEIYEEGAEKRLVYQGTWQELLQE